MCQYTSNNSIECFFIERAKYFLKPNGIMGIILPSSLLSNEGLYVKTRELLFANFNILAISAMNSRTFGSTGTNTVILFAQKVGKNAEGLLNTFITGKDYKQYLSWEEIDKYIIKQGYSKEAYMAFMQNNLLSDNLMDNEIFKDYSEAFKPQIITKQLQKEWFENSSFYRTGLKEKSKEYKELLAKFLVSDEFKELEKQEYTRMFVDYAKKIECDKLKTYIQISNNNVAVLQSPPDKVNGKTNKKEIISFLGYDWSNRKGDEGIKYVTDKKIEDLEDDDEKDAEVVMAINSIKYIKTPLYNPNDVNDNTKYSYAFRSHIEENCSKFSFGKVIQKKEEPFDGDINQLFSIKKLSDLIDFSNANFDKKINLNATENKIIKTKWPTQRIEKLLNKVKGNKTKIPQNEIMENGKTPVVSQNRNGIIEGYTDYEEVITDLPLIVFGDHSCAIKYIDFPFVRGADGTQLIKVNEEEIKSQYLYYYLNSIQIENADKYERHFKYLKTTLVYWHIYI